MLELVSSVLKSSAIGGGTLQDLGKVADLVGVMPLLLLSLLFAWRMFLRV